MYVLGVLLVMVSSPFLIIYSKFSPHNKPVKGSKAPGERLNDCMCLRICKILKSGKMLGLKERRAGEACAIF